MKCIDSIFSWNYVKLHRIQRLTRVSIHSCVAVVFLDPVEIDEMMTSALCNGGELHEIWISAIFSIDYMLRYIVYDVARLGEAGKIEPHTDNQSQAPPSVGWVWVKLTNVNWSHCTSHASSTAWLRLAATGDRCDPLVSWAWLQRWRQSFWAWLRWWSNLAGIRCMKFWDLKLLHCVNVSKRTSLHPRVQNLSKGPNPSQTEFIYIVWLGWKAQTHNMITIYRWFLKRWEPSPVVIVGYHGLYNDHPGPMT